MRALLVAIVLLAGAPARAEVTFLGQARASPRLVPPHATPPALNLMASPRDVRTREPSGPGHRAAAPSRSARFSGLLELESEGRPSGRQCFPRASATSCGVAYGYSAAFAFEPWASGTLELTAMSATRASTTPEQTRRRRRPGRAPPTLRR